MYSLPTKCTCELCAPPPPHCVSIVPRLLIVWVLCPAPSLCEYCALRPLIVCPAPSLCEYCAPLLIVCPAPSLCAPPPHCVSIVPHPPQCARTSWVAPVKTVLSSLTTLYKQRWSQLTTLPTCGVSISSILYWSGCSPTEAWRVRHVTWNIVYIIITFTY